MKPSYTACHRMTVTTIYFPFDYQTQNCRFNQHPGDEVFPEVINNVNNHLHFSLPAHHSKRLCGSLQGNILRSLALFGPLRSTWFEPYSSYLPTFSMKCKPCPSCFTPTTFHLTSVDILWNFITLASLGDISVDKCVVLIRRSPLSESLTLKKSIALPAFSPFPKPGSLVFTVTHSN